MIKVCWSTNKSVVVIYNVTVAFCVFSFMTPTSCFSSPALQEAVPDSCVPPSLADLKWFITFHSQSHRTDSYVNTSPPPPPPPRRAGTEPEIPLHAPLSAHSRQTNREHSALWLLPPARSGDLPSLMVLFSLQWEKKHFRDRRPTEMSPDPTESWRAASRSRGGGGGGLAWWH